MITLSTSQLLLMLAFAGVGGLVQGSIGFGFALVFAPMMALIEPQALPATALLMAFPLTAIMALRERHAIDFKGFTWVTSGRVLGTAAGIWLVVQVPAGRLSAVIGALIIGAVGMSLIGREFEVHGATGFIAGIFSGVMGTAAAVGGAAVALVYQDRPGPQVRSTLAFSFWVGLVLSLTGLALAGKVWASHFLFAIELLPGMLIGLWASRWSRKHIDQGLLRPAVLIFAAAAGSVAVIKGLAGL